MAQTGRPPADIDKRQFENLCGMQCTEEEICAWFGVTDKTLTRWCKRTYKKSFSEIFREKRKKGLISLRRAQFQMAEKNPSMAIWLGKQYLGQRENVAVAFVEQEADPLSKAFEALEGGDVQQ